MLNTGLVTDQINHLFTYTRQQQQQQQHHQQQ